MAGGDVGGHDLEQIDDDSVRLRIGEREVAVITVVDRNHTAACGASGNDVGTGIPHVEHSRRRDPQSLTSGEKQCRVRLSLFGALGAQRERDQIRDSRSFEQRQREPSFLVRDAAGEDARGLQCV